ncbi:MAG: hypothetical protein WCF85_02815 [Rhodospirillaceae bacterium]
MPYKDRAGFIELLECLGAEADAEVLAAARELHRRVTAAETSWQDLIDRSGLMEAEADLDTGPGDFEIRDRHDDNTYLDQEPITPRQRARFEEELTLIESLLARTTLSPETRRELLDLRADIASNEFADMDRGYLRDLAARLDARIRDD